MEDKEEYNSALERARREYDACKGNDDIACVIKAVLEKVFPELKKSEIIRRAIIKEFKLRHDNDNIARFYGVRYEDIMAWLDEHAEKKNDNQSIAWTKEDRKMYDSIIGDTAIDESLDANQLLWLKSIKDRIIGTQEATIMEWPSGS